MCGSIALLMVIEITKHGGQSVWVCGSIALLMVIEIVDTLVCTKFCMHVRKETYLLKFMTNLHVIQRKSI